MHLCSLHLQNADLIFLHPTFPAQVHVIYIYIYFSSNDDALCIVVFQPVPICRHDQDGCRIQYVRSQPRR